MTTNDDVRRDDVRTKPKKLIGVLALALAASACTSDGSDATPDSLPATETTTSASGTTADDETTETSATPASTATTAAASATTATTAAKSPSTTTTTANVGGPFDIGPAAGSTMDVVGVAYDDVLNFRSDHDASSSIVDTAAPFSTSPAIVSSGAGWLLPSSAWWNVTVDGVNAWANFRYLAMSVCRSPTSTPSRRTSAPPAPAARSPTWSSRASRWRSTRRAAKRSSM